MYPDFEPLGKSSLFTILQICKASTRKSLQGINYYAAEAGEAFDGIRKMVEDKIALCSYSARLIENLKRAQFYLGTCYDNGLGTKKNLVSAFEWYLKAAKAGHSVAQFNVGFFFATGELGITDDKKKVFWYSKSANAGFVEAQRDLGYSYFYGKGIKKDEKKAVYWYKKAASKKDDKAFYNLGLCY
ncbi:unnamed protein product, partial [Rotaria sp. Silwood1]